MYGVLNGIAEFLPTLRDRADAAARAIVIVGSKSFPSPPAPRTADTNCNCNR